MPAGAPTEPTGIDTYLAALRPVLAAHGQLPDPDEVATLVAGLLPRPARSRWAGRIGPVYTTGQLQRLLPGHRRNPISDEAVRDRHRNGRLIGFKTADGRWAWPAFQFTTAGGRLQPAAEVLELWRTLPWQDANELELISWLTGLRGDLDGTSPLEHVRNRGLDEPLVRAAGRLTGRLAA